jgi:hypothetical protein
MELVDFLCPGSIVIFVWEGGGFSALDVVVVVFWRNVAGFIVR